MKAIGSVKEDLTKEKRISITPETVKKFVNLDFSVFLEKNYAVHLGIKDEEYENLGANLYSSSKEVYKKSDILLKVNCPSSNEIDFLEEKNILIGQFDTFTEKDVINKLIKKKINVFSLSLLPRITRAQPMDVLSSQANLAGYRAVIESVEEFGKAVPMMMTAAGTITPAKVLVIGAGVAGLQAIATAKRLGGVVSATDVRAAAKEQVESLGGKFLVVEDDENLETESGYAKEVTDNFKKKQEDLLIETLKKIDIVICTALIPGKKAPRIINEKMIENMQAGSVIYDLAASQGGNSAYTKVDEVVEKDGITIIGESTILNKLPTSASNLYAKNLFNFVLNLYDKKKKKININMEDEIINKTFVK